MKASFVRRIDGVIIWFLSQKLREHKFALQFKYGVGVASLTTDQELMGTKCKHHWVLANLTCQLLFSTHKL